MTNKIREKILNKNFSDRADIKAEKIAKIKPFVYEGKYKISILEINKIDGGVECFVRAWKNGEQIGFGSDGTIDIERFRIFNPPIMARTGKKRSVLSEGKTVELDEFEENLQLALVQSIEHSIDITGKGGENIIEGKRGNTTSTFYPSLDGQAFRSSAGDSWATLIAGSGNGSDHTATTINANYWQQNGASANFVNLFRGLYLFDTSAIPDTDTIDSATVSFYGSSKSQTGTSSQATALVGTTTPSTSSIVNGDYQTVQTTRYSDTDISYASWSTAGYNDYVMNAAGLAAISKTGLTKLATTAEGHISGSAPNISGGTDWLTQVKCYSVDQSGTSNDPTLVVVHSAYVSSAMLAFF